MAATAATLAVIAGVLAWMNRYEYRMVEIAPGNMLETKRDTWTGTMCVAYATTWQSIPPGIAACDVERIQGQPTP